jgi:hypothetical protein
MERQMDRDMAVMPSAIHSLELSVSVRLTVGLFMGDRERDNI